MLVFDRQLAGHTRWRHHARERGSTGVQIDRWVPLYRRTLNWAMKKNVRAVQWPSDSPELRWLRVQP